jgi:formate dehydrogenase (NADP+) alpha subunit
MSNTFILNGKETYFKPGQTILECARENGIYIPTLCYYKNTTNVGACRICVVEVKGARNLVASCCNPVIPGMEIQTDTPAVHAAQKMILELLWASGDHNCLTCEQNGQCELQDLVYRFKIDKPRFQIEHPNYAPDESNSMIYRDMNKCILCGRCVRACNEIQVNEVLDFQLRGSGAKVGPAFDADYINSTCVFCGECLQACPTGAITFKQAKYAGRPWELDKVRTTCTYCGVGCQMDLYIKDNKIVKVMGNREYGTPNQGSLCVKGRFGMDFISHPDRLKKPLIRYKKNGELKEASWEEAYSFISNKLTAIKNANGSDSIAGFSSARVTNEENYLFQKFIRAVIGTNNVDHCARLCHASTVAGLAATFGSGAMTNSIDETELMKTMFVIGSNTTEQHPVIGMKIKKAVRQNGAKLIVADPREIDLVKYSVLWLRQKPGTDVALLNGIMNVIISEGLYDRKYVETRTEGFEDMKKVVAKYNPEYAETITGVPAEDIRKAARIYAEAEAASVFFSMGITQHTTGVDNVKSCANLSMLCGNVGIECGGVNPLRGQNNVQGSCDMGALPIVYTGYQAVANDESRAKFEKAWSVSLPKEAGLTIVETLNAAHDGKIKVLYIMGENPMLSDPDLNHAKDSLMRLDLLIVQDIFMSETARLADVVLPAVSFAEKDGTFTNTERRVQRIRKAISAPGEAKADWEIISELSTKMGYPMRYTSAEEIFKEIASITPSYSGISYDRIESEGLQWPCPTKDHPGTKFLHKDKFTRGLGLFSAIEFKQPAEVPDTEYPFVLTTGRILYQYHTGTMTRLSKGIMERCPESLMEINPEDAQKLGLQDGHFAQVSSRRGAVKVKSRVTDRVAAGTVFMNFHFNEAPANILTNPALDPIAKIPEFKVCAVQIEKV